MKLKDLDQIGYIYIQEFDDVTVEQFEEALKELEAKGMRGLVIDIRNNPGGNLDTVVETLANAASEKEILSRFEIEMGSRKNIPATAAVNLRNRWRF